MRRCGGPAGRGSIEASEVGSLDRAGTPDVVVIGAGVVGAACAYHAARAGLRVMVVDRTGIAAGTSGAGEGNLLLSDRLPGPELALAQLSMERWWAIGHELGPDAIELEAKGGLVVADTPEALAGLRTLAASHAASGVACEPVEAADLRRHEPRLAAGLLGGMGYPQDSQLQPMLAAARLLLDARDRGATVRPGVEVTGVRRGREGRLVELLTTDGPIATPAAVDAAGPWAGELARRLDVPIPVEPRRGFVLVTEPLPDLIRHKVYGADYVASVESESAELQGSPVVESTRAGTVLIGSSRERVGFDRTVSPAVLRRLAAGAIRLFPMLADVQVLRTYRGFRPYSPDHLPLIGPDPRLPGLFHATGHEGGGIGMGAGTGHLIAQLLTGTEPDLDLWPFRPERFDPGLPAEPAPAPTRSTASSSVPSRVGSPTDSSAVASPAPSPAMRPRPETTQPAPAGGRLRFDGAEVPFRPAATVGAALLGAGVRGWRSTRMRGRPRGIFCGIGICFDCLVTVDGVPNQRACLTRAEDGMEVRSQERTGRGVGA